MIVLQVVAVVLGAVIVVGTLLSAVKTIIVPRGTSSLVTRALFISSRRVFERLIAPPSLPFERRERRLAYYAPLTLILLPGVWAALAIVGFGLIFWGTSEADLRTSMELSGSSLLTLGFLRPNDAAHVALTFAEAILGLGLIALMISYLPTIYGAFSRREQLVGMLEVRAGLPPSPAELLLRYGRIQMLDQLHVELFPPWEAWFMDVEESHTSHPALVWFRSPVPERSWITAAGCILDTAALLDSVVAQPRKGQTALLLRSGFFALRRIATYFGLPHEDGTVRPDDPISVTRDEFDSMCTELEAAGIPLRNDRDQAWLDFAGWRVNYDRSLTSIAAMVIAPPGLWSSDRNVDRVTPKLLRPRAATARPA